MEGSKRTSGRGQRKTAYLVIFVELDAQLIFYEDLLREVILVKLRIYDIP